MTQSFTIDALVSIHGLMQSMLKEAQSGHWETLLELDAKRRELIDQPPNCSLTAQPKTTENLTVSHDNKVTYDTWCKDILQLDSKISELVQHSRKKLVHENRSMRDQVVAKNGYAKASMISATAYNS